MAKWYDIKLKKQADDTQVADISLHDEIGFWGIKGADFIKEFDAIPDDVKQVSLSINSPGGDVWDGLAIYNRLNSSDKTINVKVLGIAASAASIVAMAGDTIDMPESTFMMIHQPWGVTVGNADDMRETADILDKINMAGVNIYAKRTGLKADEVAEMMKSDTYMTAAEAKAKGFADTVSAKIDAKASFEIDKLPAALKAAYMMAQPHAAAADPEPKPEPDPKPEPVVEQKGVVEVVALIEAAATSAGMGEYAASWALDAEIADAADPKVAVQQRIAHAKEVKQLCALCKAPDNVDKLFIQQKTSLKDVRAKLLDSQASKDEAQSIDVALKITKPQASIQSAPVAEQNLEAEIWAMRRGTAKAN